MMNWNENSLTPYENAQLDVWRTQMQIPPRFVHASIPEKERDMFIEGQSIYLFGRSGNGKTHRICGYLHQRAIEKVKEKQYHPDALFVSYPNLLRLLRESYGANGNAHTLEAYINIPYLILDDFGGVKETEWVNEMTFVLIDQRYQKCLPTIITSNVTIDDLEKTYGARVRNRIAVMCDPIEVESQQKMKFVG